MIVIINSAFGQVISCGFDYYRQFAPDYQQKEERMNQVLFQRTLTQYNDQATRPTITIPVVVHIIHQNGAENISDAEVIAGIEEMNLRFRNEAPYYDATGSSVGIQFCLASVDPQGNPTTGITRDISVYSYLWASDDVMMKNVNRWDPYYYYNIWVVHSISGFEISVSGYSTLPSNLGEPSDGVVIQYSAIDGTVLTHETGHYLGLYHTFQGGCLNLNSLLDGDCVYDTPPDNTTTGCMGNSCSTEMEDTSGFNPFISDVNELPNYMDYTSCPLSFSQGQTERMNYATTDIRTLLLESHGCGFNGGTLPIAVLGYEISPCNDGVVEFTNSLSTDITTVNWDFNNDGIYDSFSNDPTYTYPATGTYTVKLRVAGPAGFDETSETIFVQKAPAFQYYPIVEIGSTFINQYGDLTSCDSYTNNLTSAPAVSYLWSTGETTQSISFVPTETYTISLSIVDGDGLTWSNEICNPLIVNVHPSPPTANIYTDEPTSVCDGDQVTFHSGFNTTDPYTFNWYQNSQPTDLNDTVFTATCYNTSVPFMLIIGDEYGCYSWSNYVYINAYNAPMTQSLTQEGSQLISGWGGGNQWYLDGVIIPGATGQTYDVLEEGCYTVAWFFGYAPLCQTMSDPICIGTSDLEQLKLNQELINIYPVPSSDFVILKANSEFVGSTYLISDPLGRIVLQGKLESEETNINISNLAKGVYFIELQINENKIVRKIVRE